MSTVTLRQIAEEAGCTRATVSYALKNSPGISDDTKRRIRAIAERLGWRPDPALSRQMALTRGVVTKMFRCNLAILVQKPSQELLADPIPRAQFEGARDRAAQLGFGLSVLNLADEPLSPTRLKAILHARRVLGVVFMAAVGSNFGKEYLAVGRDRAASVIAVRYPEIGYHVAITDFLANGLIALEEMKKLGFRRVGAVLPRAVDGTLDWSFTAGLVAGYLKYYGSRDLPLFHSTTDEIRLTERDKRPLLRWLQENKPEAVLTSDPYNYTRLTRDYSGRMPRIFSLNFVDGEMQGEGGIDQRYGMAGAAAVDLVVAQLHRDERGVPEVQKSVQIAGKWVWGAESR